MGDAGENIPWGFPDQKVLRTVQKVIKMDHAKIVFMNMDFYSAQVSDRVTCSIQFLKTLSGVFC